MRVRSLPLKYLKQSHGPNIMNFSMLLLLVLYLYVVQYDKNIILLLGMKHNRFLLFHEWNYAYINTPSIEIFWFLFFFVSNIQKGSCEKNDDAIMKYCAQTLIILYMIIIWSI